MEATTYLRNQFANLHNVFHSIVDDLTDEEWLARPAPRQNLVGHTVWHIPRIQDSILQVWIRGLPEVAHAPRWSHWQALKPLGVGVGITLEEADRIAYSASKADTLAYADEVAQTIQSWLASTGPEDLDKVNDVRGRLSGYPEYQTPGFIEEVEGLFSRPVADQLMRPCIGHVHRHLGELELVKTILRAR